MATTFRVWKRQHTSSPHGYSSLPACTCITIIFILILVQLHNVKTNHSRVILLKYLWGSKSESQKKHGKIPQSFRNAGKPGGQWVDPSSNHSRAPANKPPSWSLFHFCIYLTSAVKQKRLHLLQRTGWQQETKTDAAVNIRGNNMREAGLNVSALCSAPFLQNQR